MKKTSFLLVVILLLFNLLNFSSSFERSEWKKCINLPILGETCIDIYFDPKIPDIVIELTIQNKTMFVKNITDRICVDDGTLLELLKLIPQLAPFKKIIDLLILERGKIPGEVLSICTDVKNYTYVESEAEGDVYLDITLMCWKKKCLYKNDVFVGHFKVHIPEILLIKDEKLNE